jgi:copper(I)-binding protein
MEHLRRAARAALTCAIGASLLVPPIGALAAMRHSLPALPGEGPVVGAEAATPSEYTLGSLHIKAPWMRATPKGAKVAGGYLLVTNMGKEPDRLLTAESDIATTVGVHQMTMSNGVMTMRPVEDPLEIAPGATLELKPGGYHIMFSGLKRGVQEGDKVKTTLAFEKAGKIEIEFVAGAIAASGPAMPMHKM